MKSDLLQPFLTDIDSRWEVKGSVDPLGITSLWSRLGRRIINNLTTVSSSLNDFKTLLLGFALIEDLRAQVAADEEVDGLGAFLRWEQLAAYVRLRYNKDKAFRGTTRVQRWLNEGVVVAISKDRDCQILGSQQTYGLWGLFTVPARSSGLLENNNNLTLASREFVSRTWRRELGPIWKDLLTLIAKDNRRVNLDQWSRQLKRLSRVWSETDNSDKPFWTDHLLQGGPNDPTEGRQALLASFLRVTDGEFRLSPTSVRSLMTKASRKDGKLAGFLADIIAAEAVLAPAALLFGFLQQRDGQTLEETATAIRRAWPAQLKAVDVEHFTALQHLFVQVVGPFEASAWLATSSALRDGRYRDVVELLLSLNESVMKRRGGSPWVADEGGVLRVRYRDEPSDLPGKSDLPELWRHQYFIDSLRVVGKQIEAA